MKQFLAWALIALPILTACENDDELNDDKEGAGGSVEVTMKSLAGEWYINEPEQGQTTIENLTIKADGSFVLDIESSYKDEVLGKEIVSYVEHVEGKFELDGTILRGNISKAQSKRSLWENGEYKGLSDWEDDESYSIPENAEVSLLRGGSLLLLESDYGVMMYFKKGGKLPNNKSELQGTWFSYESYKAGDQTISVAIKIDGDNIDIIVAPWAQRFICKYTYKDGIIANDGGVTFRTLWREDGCNDLNNEDPFDSEWLPTYDPDQYTGNLTDGFSFPFVVDGNNAYSMFVGRSPFFTKQ